MSSLFYFCAALLLAVAIFLGLLAATAVVEVFDRERNDTVALIVASVCGSSAIMIVVAIIMEWP